MAAITPDEIAKNLKAFVKRYKDFTGTEKAEAQTFLNRLFDAYGVVRDECGAEFESPKKGKFLDLLWPEKVLIEMKRPSETDKLEENWTQAYGYWKKSADVEAKVAAPKYVVLCSFQRFLVYEPGRFPDSPLLDFGLEELPEKWEALKFLTGERPEFRKDEVAVTVKAVERLAALHKSLELRDDLDDEDEIDDFVLQCVWCLFAEDAGLIPKELFSKAAERCIGPDRSTANELGDIFQMLDKPLSEKRYGFLEGVPYANGEMFSRPARIDLTDTEIEYLLEAAKEDWTKIQPQIIGSLLEGTMKGRRDAVGVHYTHEEDIMKVVGPVVVEPWQQRIGALTTWDEACDAHEDLVTFRILDPACGSGNFLYVAYREMRRLQEDLRARAIELGKAEGRQNLEKELQVGGKLGEPYPVYFLHGIEIKSFPVKLARLTLWIGHTLTVRELGLNEATLPLSPLPEINQGDALKVDWPTVSAIVGNPPFLGSQNLRGEMGDEYVKWLEDRFGVGVKDLCVYFFRKAHDRLTAGQRAGLVGTNSVSQNRARGASLDYIAANGGVIFNAVSKLKWPGDAVVNVSIVNWVKDPEAPVDQFELDGEVVAAIDTALRSGDQPAEQPKLEANRGRSFQGPIPVGAGFIIDATRAEELIAADRGNSRVVRPYLIGEDIARNPSQGPSRWVIDFGAMTLEQASKFSAPLASVRDTVKPVRDRNRDKRFREEWWRFGRPRGEMRVAITSLHRFIAGTATGKRFLFAWVDASVCPSNATNVFAFSDDYAMGVLTAKPHVQWAIRQSSTLEDRLRYTPTSAFETYPWPPSPTPADRALVGDAAKKLLDLRSELCLKNDIGLTTLYNQLDEGAHQDLKKLHTELDKAVAKAYGWPAKVVGDAEEIIKRLKQLSADITSGKVDYRPFDGWADKPS